MKKFITSAILSLALLGCQESAKESAKQEAQHDHSKHHHGLLEISDLDRTAPAPTLRIQAHPDSMSGWNIQIETSNFRFTPEKVNTDASVNEGHAHLYVDGYKLARIYSNWYHMKALTPGQHEVKVTLNANNHSTFGHNGQEIAATVNIEQK